jgi:hypothetical protein
LERAAEMVRPGDVVWIRGGVYASDATLTHSGAPGRPIVFESYPGECAVIEGLGSVKDHHLTLSEVRYNVLRNLVLRNSMGAGVLLVGSDHNTVSHVLSYGNVSSGIAAIQSNDNRFEFFVSHDNFDPPTGGGADGISISSGDGNRVSHCVVYNNSDDGLDTWKSTHTVVDRCISVHNGYQGGDGIGFKAGGARIASHTVVRNSLAYANKDNGFDHNSSVDVRFDNDTAFANGGYGFVAGRDTLRNNLSIGNRAGPWFGKEYGNVTVTNSWDLGIRGNPFLSTDPKDPSFLSLVPGSGAVDAGTDLGQPFAGRAPDLGALPLGETVKSVVGVDLLEAMHD